MKQRFAGYFIHCSDRKVIGANRIKALVSFQQAFIGWESSFAELPVTGTDSEQECPAVPDSVV